MHAQYAGHPIAGDNKYGDKKFNTKMQQLGLHRLFLHSGKISFTSSDKEIVVEAPIDQELLDILDVLKSKLSEQ